MSFFVLLILATAVGLLDAQSLEEAGINIDWLKIIEENNPIMFSRLCQNNIFIKIALHNTFK